MQLEHNYRHTSFLYCSKLCDYKSQGNFDFLKYIFSTVSVMFLAVPISSVCPVSSSVVLCRYSEGPDVLPLVVSIASEFQCGAL